MKSVMHSTSANHTFLVAHPEGGDENLPSANRGKKKKNGFDLNAVMITGC